MEIRKVSPDDSSACAQAVAVLQAATEVDSPEVIIDTPKSFAAGLKHGWDGDPGEAFLATDGGVPVGLLSVEAPTYDNTNLAWFEVEVHPEHRGRGIGTVLLHRGFDRARELGRTSLGFSQWDLPRADAFARRHGFEQKAIEVNRRQDLDRVDWATVDKLYDEAAQVATDYELVRLIGELPEELLDPMVALTASINDAPTDDLDIEDDVYTRERLRAYEQAQAAHDRKLCRVIARHKHTGELAGHSAVTVENERPHIAWQADTAVDRAHRGHRLGALVKTGMLRWLREDQPAVTLIDTWNAESNDHMIGINEQLGYRIIARTIAYQRAL
jgi:GNAT superfamily N-acetyltransferase